jgi:hypothetical protein
LKKIISILMLAIAVCTAQSAFAAGNTSATTANVTTTIIRPISVTKNTDLHFGTIVRPGSGLGTVALTAANVSTVTGTGAILLPSSTTSAANFTVSGEGAQAFTLVIDSTVTLTNTAASGGTLTVTTVNDAACTTSCALPGTLGDVANDTKVVNVAGSFPFTSTTNTGAYSGTLNISVTYN